MLPFFIIHLFMQLYFLDQAAEKGSTVLLNQDESKHCIKVLRKTTKDILSFTDGKGSLFTGEIIDPSTVCCKVMIIEKKTFLQEKPTIHIAVSPLKQPERIEWFIEKATETGISEITPLICSRTEKSNINIERLKKISLSAMKQSGRYFLPIINPPVKFNEFIPAISKTNIETQIFIGHCREDNKKSLKSSYLSGSNAIILIGPEGDFTEAEISKAIEQGVKPVELARNRLRTETAALVACHTLILINSD